MRSKAQGGSNDCADPSGSIEADLSILFAPIQPKAVSETDDLELNALMERVARENKEVSGDEASDEED
jgi:translation initiation factor 2 subunit 1